MSIPTAADLIHDLEVLDAALVSLADAYADYLRDSEAISRRLYSDPRPTAQFTFASTIGGERVAQLLAMRLRGLGLDRVLLAARHPGVVGPDWLAPLRPQVAAQVPAA